GEGVLEEGLRLAAVAGVVDVAEPGGLGDQALDAASECVALAPVAGGLLGPDPLLGLLLTAGQEGHVPGVVLGAGTAGPVGAGAAVGLAEGSPDDRQAVAAAGGAAGSAGPGPGGGHGGGRPS